MVVADAGLAATEDPLEHSIVAAVVVVVVAPEVAVAAVVVVAEPF